MCFCFKGVWDWRAPGPCKTLCSLKVCAPGPWEILCFYMILGFALPLPMKNAMFLQRVRDPRAPGPPVRSRPLLGAQLVFPFFFGGGGALLALALAKTWPGRARRGGPRRAKDVPGSPPPPSPSPPPSLTGQTKHTLANWFPFFLSLLLCGSLFRKRKSGS